MSLDPTKKEQMLATDIRQLILRICGKNATRSLDWATVENAVGISKVVLVTAHGLPSILPLHSQTNKESVISRTGMGCGNISAAGESVTHKKRQFYTELPFLRRAKFQSKEKPLTQRKAIRVKVFAGRQTTDVGRVVLRAPPARSKKSNEDDKKKPIPSRASALDMACPPQLLVCTNASFAMRQMLHAVI